MTQAAARGAGFLLQPRDIVALPALDRNRDGRDLRQRRFGIDAPVGEDPFGDVIASGMAVSPLIQRVKACTLPASTFRIFPVDFDARSDAKKYAASAISSG